jgi:solute carrier family 25 (mitochondrial S-adenosylmethionine transporter), member 26
MVARVSSHVAKAPSPKRRNRTRNVAAAKASAAAAISGSIPLTFGEQMLAGAIARGAAQTLLHPVDVVRTRLQAKNVVTKWSAGVFAKGVLPQMLLASPAGALQFAAFELAKDKLAEINSDDSTRELRMLLAGASGALAAAFFRVPQEVLKQRIQADIYPNLAVALRETLGSGGPAALYKGWLATISRDVPWNALSFMFHGRAKRLFASVKGRQPKNDENLALAGVSGALAAIIMTPVDVVKTRLMTQRIGAAVQYSGIFNTLQTIVKEEGAGVLMKGVLPRIVFLAPLAGITFSLYEAVANKIRARKLSSRVASSGSPADNAVAAAVPATRSGLFHRRQARQGAIAFVAAPQFSFGPMGRF